MSAPIVQYVVVRSDLLHVLKWPTGALIAQTCHACSAALHLFKDDENTKSYFADLDNMHKVVLEVSEISGIITHHTHSYAIAGIVCRFMFVFHVPNFIPFQRMVTVELVANLLFGYAMSSLQAKSEEQLKNLSDKLTENKVDHKLWIEQPENIPTCIATKPYPKAEIQGNFKKFKLFK